MPSYINSIECPDLIKNPHLHGAGGEKLIENTRCLLDYDFEELLEDIRSDLSLPPTVRTEVASAFERCAALRTLSGMVPRGRYYLKPYHSKAEPEFTHEITLRAAPGKITLWKVASLQSAEWFVIFRLGFFATTPHF